MLDSKPKLPTNLSEELQLRFMRTKHFDDLLEYEQFDRMDIDLTILIKKVITDANNIEIFSVVEKIFCEIRDSREFENFLNSMMETFILIHKKAFEKGRESKTFTLIKSGEQHQ